MLSAHGDTVALLGKVAGECREAYCALLRNLLALWLSRRLSGPACNVLFAKNEDLNSTVVDKKESDHLNIKRSQTRPGVVRTKRTMAKVLNVYRIAHRYI
jgi:hypothetical protein